MTSAAIYKDRQLAKLHAKVEVWIAQGLCRACGQETELDRKHCAYHLAYFRRYQRERRRSQRK